MSIKKNVTELVGNTPLLEIKPNLYAKLEMFNPAGSVKDRIALNMLLKAIEEKTLQPGQIIVEATSGNTGIGLAAMGSALGYEVNIVMPETMSIERRQLMMAYGAKLILTDGALGMKGAIAKAMAMKEADPEGVFLVSQFENQHNPTAHFETTAKEIYDDLNGQVDIVVAGVGTGGTITGIGHYLKSVKADVQLVAVEPASSAVLSGESAGKHKIQGIGAGFVPKVLDIAIYDQVMAVSDEDAFDAAKKFARENGLLIGISAGAALFAALKLAAIDENKDKKIVVIFADGGERYLSTALYQ